MLLIKSWWRWFGSSGDWGFVVTASGFRILGLCGLRGEDLHLLRASMEPKRGPTKTTVV